MMKQMRMTSYNVGNVKGLSITSVRSSRFIKFSLQYKTRSFQCAKCVIILPDEEDKKMDKEEESDIANTVHTNKDVHVDEFHFNKRLRKSKN